ncbi:MAG: radical SAM protein [Polyangiaceae bacterium]|nr:radical SAM protein [Polyangiaceae bacterium]
MSRWESAETIRARLGREVGRIEKSAPFTVALAYPSPYRAGMSSLGFQQIYKLIQRRDGTACQRFFLPDDAEGVEVAPLSYEGLRPLRDFPVIAFSVAYELELAGVVQMLEASAIPSLRAERTDADPIVVAGGPLTFSNPLPLAPFVDAIVMGEADELIQDVMNVLESATDKTAALEALAAIPHVFVPSAHGSTLPSVAKCADETLPAYSAIRSPDTELSDMFLIETERGCSRACQYCVMRRSTNGGMRIVKKETILGLIPEDARRVGLVGAAVSDHPKVAEIVRTLAERGCEVGLSSLRPDRLNDEFVGALRSAGYKTLTTAMDGPSERLRESLERRARIKHLHRAAELARAHGMKRLKLYLMVGLPGETDADIDECSAFVSELSAVVPVALGIAPFCAKRNTPLDKSPFAGISTVNARLERLRRGLKGRADVRATSARWAWAEYVLAQGGEREGLAVRTAVHAGGTFADYKRAFEAVAERAPMKKKKSLHVVAS